MPGLRLARSVAIVALILAGCGSPESQTDALRIDGDGGAPTAAAPGVTVAGTVVTGLNAPWGVAFLPGGAALVSERDTARVLEVRDGGAAAVGSVEGVVPAGEGGLLGIAYADGWVYAYLTAAADNRVIRMPWDGTTLGAPQPVLTGIPKAGIHNGGRIAFGPDGMLYIATGDASVRAAAQDRTSPAGKILRVTPEGAIPADNPFPGSPVYSLGHRNVQGLAFDSRNRLWASEFGQSDVDELNLIAPASNYGWPVCEGGCATEGFVDPVAQWEPTSIASPSGLAIVGDYAYVASLRGETVWQVPLSGDKATRLAVGDLGRLRTIVAAPDGSLWLSTSNTDGRGDPRAGDDRILRLTIS